MVHHAYSGIPRESYLDDGRRERERERDVSFEREYFLVFSFFFFSFLSFFFLFFLLSTANVTNETKLDIESRYRYRLRKKLTRIKEEEEKEEEGGKQGRISFSLVEIISLYKKCCIWAKEERKEERIEGRKGEKARKECRRVLESSGNDGKQQPR